MESGAEAASKVKLKRPSSLVIVPWCSPYCTVAYGMPFWVLASTSRELMVWAVMGRAMRKSNTGKILVLGKVICSFLMYFL